MQDEKFLFKKIESSLLLEEAFRLRYQVYCKECHFIREADYPKEVESDAFDEHSMHFGAFDLDDRLIGFIRIILSSCSKFPIEEHCPDLRIEDQGAKREESVEVSRLVISKTYRRRAFDGLYYEPRIQDDPVEDKGEVFMRRMRPMAFGLYRAIYHESKRKGIRYWFALMERSLWLLLKIHGFVFHPIGPEIDFYGKVRPYRADLQEMEKNVYSKFPKFFEYFMKGLEESYQPKF